MIDKKNIKIIASSIIIIVLIFMVIIKLSTFTIFDDEIEVIRIIKVPKKNYTIKIVHIPSNASSQSYIQVRIMENDKERVVKNYERYDRLVNYKINGDTLLLEINNSTLNNSVVKKFFMP